MSPRAGLDDVKRNFLTTPGFELRPLSRPASSQSLYRLSYQISRISIPMSVTKSPRKLHSPNLAESLWR
jgi:hypothetical protein